MPLPKDFNKALKIKAQKIIEANLDPPFSRFEGRLKQLHVDALADVFDVFFPRFRTEVSLSSFISRGRGRALAGDVALAGDSAAFVGRGRERRFSGDETLPRKHYYCVEDAPTNDPANNTLLCELFAYADPRSPLVPELLDTTVDVEQGQRLCQAMGWDSLQPSVLHIVRPRDEPWLLPPTLGIPSQGCVLRYPLTISDAAIERTIDLRKPDTLQWFLNVFVSFEVLCQGDFVDSTGHVNVTLKGEPPGTIEEFLPTILAQSPGGGSTFIQGIGACVRSIGAEALIYPSARADSRSVTQSGTVKESFGYVLVDYRGAPECNFDPRRYFGGLPHWADRIARRVTVTRAKDGDSDRLDIMGVRKLQECRYAVFHDWALNSFNVVRSELKSGEKRMGDQVKLALRRPSDIVGTDCQRFLGSDEEFRMEQGPVQGFLVEWIVGPYNTVAGFISSMILAAQSKFWEDRWNWDGKSWFLYRLCRCRPWAILKCPICLTEYFWKIASGSLIRSCIGCHFTQPNVDEILKSYEEWAQTRQESDRKSDDVFYATDAEVYDAVCFGLVDAITGEKPRGGTP